VPYEIDQDVKHLWLDVDDSTAPVQFTAVTVDFAVPKHEGHMPASENL
jgi:hypothetical protein